MTPEVNWFPSAIHRPGPAAKIRGWTEGKTGATYHSADGWLPGTLDIVLGTHSGVAWHFTNPLDGPLLQHYPPTAIVWHAAGGNTRTVGVENIGRTAPLTPSQRENLARLSVWLKQRFGWGALSREPLGRARVGDAPLKTLWEHKEIIGSATDCPVDRIPWTWILNRAADLEEEDDMTPQEMLEQLLKLHIPLYGGPSEGPVDLKTLLHYAYYGSPVEHKKLVTKGGIQYVIAAIKQTRNALTYAQAVLVSHIREHNQSGGILDRYSGEHLEKLAELLGQMETEVGGLADLFKTDGEEE